MTESTMGDREKGSNRVGAVALVADLLFASRIRGVAALTRVPVATVGSRESLWRVIREQRPQLILIDLDARIGDVPALISELRSDPASKEVMLIAFGSHLEREALQAAREAGADQVLARSGFVRQLPTLLQGMDLND